MMVPQRAKRAWVLAVVIGTLPFQTHAEDANSSSTANSSSAINTSSGSHAGYECAFESETQPSSPKQWLELGLWASHCYAFQARAVAIDSVDVRTLALSHRIQDGIRQQVVQYLDGPSVSIERRSPVGRLAWTEEHSNGELPSPERWAAHLEKYYAIELEDNARVAGRAAVKLIFKPVDRWRFSHEWWLDQETGLLLKHVLSDQQGRIIETFQITQLQSPQKYTGSVRTSTPNAIPNTPWQATWLPDGFVAQPVSLAGDNGHQRVYSDGLATVSIFVEPLASEDTTTLQEGVQQLGVSAVAIEHTLTAEGRWQLVAIGELPVATLQRIVRSITFDLLEDETHESDDAAEQ
ncbi:MULTISPECIES: MucB/RseB C-terminal domain-containing protein [unclassified Halomonas]|uniref:MucB/RseB C-terminal domain-containing protein n=1 Tax=unclassified Halomonas TaxID=2609666 RepID=UPI0007DA0770|nr:MULTISPECIES: MucB/RseB C-terminal domain-containing protein [unclassified Halomonas]MBT2788303.1 MucB/RseB C-terminal domain-containing protein [Halomonas sp. ISL-106]MBT2796052.1 MucB/RseB C-terminal domain-containing protein [Halomonas sp. ISL-104]OAL61321.1 nucleoside transporter [Halomonas sp. ALS9]